MYPGGKDDTFTISWHPYYLDPEAPKQGVPVSERMMERFGPGRVEAMQRRLLLMGESEGLAFSFRSKLGNTRDSHRMIQLGKTKGAEVENRVVHEIMKSYFEGGGDITSADMLVDAAEKAGLDPAEARD